LIKIAFLFFDLIAGAITFKILLKIVTGNHFCFFGALSKNYPYVLSIIGAALHGKGGTRPVAFITFIQIDHTFLHHIADVLFTYLAATHSALCMPGVLQL
jgi:hypothetical protein